MYHYAVMVWWYFSAPPGPPIPKVTDWTKSSVDLEWTPPLKDGGSRVTGYIVEYKEEGKEEWERVGGKLLLNLCFLSLCVYQKKSLQKILFLQIFTLQVIF